MSVWKAEHLRISIFVAGSIPAPKDIILNIFRVDVESASEKGFGAESKAEGVWMEKKIEVRKHVNRLDFILSPVAKDEFERDALDQWRSDLPVFLDVVGGWLAIASIPVIRCAVSLVGLLPVDSRDDGYIEFGNYVRPVKMRVKDFSDINFQVNIPIASTVVQGLEINRISSWAVAFAKVVSMGLGGNLMHSETTYALRALVDVNTSAERSEPLPSNTLKNILVELSGSMVEILDKGVD